MRPHRQPTRLLRLWDSPGKNTGVGCHFLLQCMKVKSESEVTQLCLTLRDPMDCSPLGSSIHGILQARMLEWKIAYWLKMYPNDMPKKGLVPKIYRQLVQFVDFKKCTMWELRVKFYLGQNEDCNLGDSSSDSCEKLPQRGRGERSVYMWFWWRENTCNEGHIFPKVFY